MTMRLFLLLLFISTISFAQTNKYHISFENAVHHEAKIQVTFPKIKTHTLTVRMSRTSPGRYALHEFAKNVYGFQATNSKGEQLSVQRPDPYSWKITGHDGTVQVSYLLFANRADGTYSQIDDTHAHLNIPATFMYAETLEHRPIEVTFNMAQDSNWKVATQLSLVKGTTYTAPDLHYFMDSPTELSDFQERSFEVDGQTIRFALHGPNTSKDFDIYWDKVKQIVKQEKAVFGELPAFDYGTYTFIACYDPHVYGDGMEHRNSTILTDRETLDNGGMKGNISTVSHEFFHAWNVERIRPADLEPFYFTKANMSGNLWFAEGFTSYYTNLILARAGLISEEDYVKSLNGTFNYVWNSPARQYFNPIEMSYQAPFVDAATSVDPVNRENTFISYYSYGSVLGLALDLSLREKGLNLDNYFKRVWQRFGKNEVSYTVEDLEEVLTEYAGDAFAKAYFSNYIYNSEMPAYEQLFETVGIIVSRNETKPSFGVATKVTEEGVLIARNPSKNSAAYIAGLTNGDLITDIDGSEFIKTQEAYDKITKDFKVGDTIILTVQRHEKAFSTALTLMADPTYTIALKENPTKEQLKARTKWLEKK